MRLFFVVQKCYLKLIQVKRVPTCILCAVSSVKMADVLQSVTTGGIEVATFICWLTLQNVHSILRESSSVRQVNAERLRKCCVLDAVQGSPRTNVHRISTRTDIASLEVRRLLSGDDFYLRRWKECKTDYREITLARRVLCMGVPPSPPANYDWRSFHGWGTVYA
jgi:hypothetical protein